MTLLDVLSALVSAGLPLFLLSFALVSLALRRGWLTGATVQEIQDSIDVLDKSQSKKKSRQRINPVLDKWFSFGGGFYGLVALYTWLLIEWDDALDFLRGLGGVVINFDVSGLFALVIELFIESLMNFVWAISWPAYWLSQPGNAVLLLAAAYAGYWLGIKTAQHGWENGWLDRIMGNFRARLRRRP